MIKQSLFLLLAAAVAGGIYFFVNYEIQTCYENGKPAYWKIVPKTNAAAGRGAAGDLTPDQLRPTIRIATFQLGRLDEAKLANTRVSDVLVNLFPRFELVAVQGIRGKNQGVLDRLVEQINAKSGRNYNFATCPTQKRDGLEHYSAFVYDRQRIDIDQTTVHFVEDRSGRLRIKPLTGSFRVRGPDPAEAFTFTLINVETDPEHTATELDVLADVYRAVRDDGRGEDDIILLGDLESDDQNLGQLGKLLGVSALISGIPTTTRGTHQLDNILLDRRATSEFDGRVEVLDMMREFDLTMPEALEVSEHLPVWAEFSVYEGGQPGRPSHNPN